MNIIITKRFEDKYLKYLLKNFSKEVFIKMLKEKNHTFISLHQPYFKIKNTINSISIRWILLILEEDNIVPLMIFLKKDKKYWENINWKEYKDIILEEQELSFEDIKNGNYKEY